MAKYKHYDYQQTKLVPVSFEAQIIPGTFEHTLKELIDKEVDLSVFEARYKNDETGAPAYDPAILLKIILYAYSRGITWKPRDRTVVRGEHRLHGALGRQSAALHHDCELHLDDE